MCSASTARFLLRASACQGRAADLLGRRRVFLVALGVFIVAAMAGCLWPLLTAGAAPHYVVTVLLPGGGFGFKLDHGAGHRRRRRLEQGLTAGLVRSSGQVGTARILAVVTALVAIGAQGGRDFTPFHSGVNLITGVAVAGLLFNLIPLVNRRPRVRHG